jgi:hypothetical protein
MAANPCEVKVLQVKHNSCDEITVLVRDTAAVLTLRGVKLFTHAGGHSCGPGTTTTATTSTRGCTRLDIFDVERDAAFLVSDYGAWNVNTSALDGATLVAKHAPTTSCTGGGGVAGVKRDSEGSAYASCGPTPRRKQRTSMV